MSYRDFRRMLVASNGTIAAIESRAASALAIAGAAIARGERVSDGMLAAAAGASDQSALDAIKVEAAKWAAPMLVPMGKSGNKMAIVSFRGLVTYDFEMQPLALSLRAFTAHMRQLAADESVKSIVLYVDSPGGSVYGLPEAADAVWEARKSKRVTAVVDVLCASAAYFVASQATEIFAMPSGAGVGSIGVRMMHVDCSRAMQSAGVTFTHIYSGEYKVEGNPYEPLSEDARARYQLECDTLYQQFLSTVARGRGTTAANVRENFGKGRVLMPAEAKRVGMIDKLEEPGIALNRLGVFAFASQAEPSAAVVTGNEQQATEVEDTKPQATETVADPPAQEELVNQELTSNNEVEQPPQDARIRLRAALDLYRY